jgi:site-specific recombinase XerC
MRQPRTIAAYMPVVEDLAEFLPRDRDGNSLSLRAIRRADLSKFLQDQARTERTLSKALWNVRLAALRAFFDYLFKQEVIDVNPAQRIDRFKIKPPPRVPLDLDEMITLVEAVESQSPSAVRTRNVAIVQVLIHCGLRGPRTRRAATRPGRPRCSLPHQCANQGRQDALGPDE